MVNTFKHTTQLSPNTHPQDASDLILLATFILLATLLLLIVYLYFLPIDTATFPTPCNKRIYLLIAHPDDEAMFFAPTILALTRLETRNHVQILCLSSGNAQGLGETRKRELVKSGLILGIKREEDISVVDDPVDFPDTMTGSWSAEKISSFLRKRFTPSPDPPRSRATVDILITFDSHGVSSHPNHISLYHGARAFVSSLTQDDSSWQQSHLDLYTLTSVNFF